MVIPSPSCAKGHARDVGWHHAVRLICGAASVLSLTLAVPALAEASTLATSPAPGIAAAMSCTASTPHVADDLFETPAHQPARSANVSPDRLLDPIDDDDEDEQERFRTRTPHGNLEIAFRLRRQSHAWNRSLTPDDGLLPHQFLIDSVRRL